MTYDWARLTDWARVNSLISQHGHYTELDTGIIRAGGRWRLIRNDANVAIAAIWALVHLQHCTLDYLVIDPAYHGQGLGSLLITNLVSTQMLDGVRYYHGVVWDENNDWVTIPGTWLHPEQGAGFNAFYILGSPKPL
jgi:GNAT superfamily N-acetyltransferase